MGKIKGIIYGVTTPTGRIIASGLYNERCSAAGIDDLSYQKSRVFDVAAKDTVSALAHPDLFECVDQYTSNQILRELMHKKGYGFETKVIGYDEETC